jgi:hypothetical protein
MLGDHEIAPTRTRNLTLSLDLPPGAFATRMRLAAALATLLCCLLAATAAHAGLFKPSTGRWCALTAIGLNDCSYDTFAQCMATLSGVGGVCSINAQAPPVPDQPPPRKRKRRSAPR